MISINSIGNICLSLRPFSHLTKRRGCFHPPRLSKAGRLTFSRQVALLLRKESQSHLLFLLLSDEKSILPCKKEELQCGDGLCLLNWLRCHYKKDCGRDYMSIKLTCSSELPFTLLNHDKVLHMWTHLLARLVFVAVYCLNIRCDLVLLLQGYGYLEVYLFMCLNHFYHMLISSRIVDISALVGMEDLVGLKMH